MSEILPPLYEAWIAELLPSGLSPEPRATCLDCAMTREPADTGFHPSVKCCTYYPALSNFLVGRVLADDSPGNARGRDVIAQRLASRLEVTPLGIWPTPAYQVLYEHSVRAINGTFGRTPALRCPFYIDERGGLCGIWRHREAVCATWYCKFERGARGAVFWQLLNGLLRQLESALRIWCVTQLDLGEDALRASWIADGNRQTKPAVLDHHALNGSAEPHKYARLWGRYLGREAELYQECAALAGGLSFEQVLDIGGAPARLAARVVREFFDRMAVETPLPSHVIMGHVLVQLGRRPRETRLRNPSVPHDPVDLPTAVTDALPRLAGEPLRTNLAALRAEGLELDDALVRTLLDYEILIAS